MTKVFKHDDVNIYDILDTDFNDAYEGVPALLLIKFAEQGYPLFYGRHRAVFDLGSWVVKIPTCDNGYADNDWEGSITSQSKRRDIQYAETRMVYYRNIPIVFMEKIIDASFDEIRKRLKKVPDWVYSVDCQQVGFNKHGELKAYDYGIF